MDEEFWDPVGPACHKVRPEDDYEMCDRLLTSGMCTLVEESKLPTDSKGNILVGGLFAVHKDTDQDRLIFDRRPQNASELRLRWSTLPGGARERVCRGPRGGVPRRRAPHGARRNYKPQNPNHKTQTPNSKHQNLNTLRSPPSLRDFSPSARGPWGSHPPPAVPGVLVAGGDLMICLILPAGGGPGPGS